MALTSVRSFHFALPALVLLCPCANTAFAQLGPGDIVVVDSGLEAVLGIDVTTIDRNIVSSSAVGAGDNFVTPQGVALDGSGNILLTDTGVPALFQVDPASGDRTTLSSFGTGTGPDFVTPRGVAIDGSGNILVADAGVPALFKVDPATGNRTLLSTSGTGTGPNFASPHGVTLDGNGDILVSDAGVRALFRVSPMTGDRVIISQGGAGGVGVGTAFAAPQGIAKDATGDILVVDAGISSLFRVDPATGNRSILSSSGAGTGDNFVTPECIAVDGNGTLFVTDSSVRAVFRVEPSSGNRTIISSAGVGTGPNFVTPRGIETDAGGNILVADAVASAVIRVNPTAGAQPVISADKSSPVGQAGTGPKLLNPRGVAIDSNADILVAEKQLKALVRVDPATGNRTILSAGTNTSVGPLGSGPNFSFPWGVGLASNGDPLVADSQLKAIIRIDRMTGDRTAFSAGTNSSVGPAGSGADFGNPRGLALLADGNVLVADAGAAAVWRVDQATGDRTAISSASVGSGPIFGYPWGIVLEADGNILVVDRDLEAVVRVDPVSGDRAIVSKGVIGSGPNMDLPQDLTLDSNGDILVVDSSLFSLFRIDPVSGSRTIVSQFIEGEVLGSPRGITAVPAFALSSTNWFFQGTAQGGAIEFAFGFLILRVVTTMGQTATEVAAAIAQAINNNGTLSAAGITATALGNRVTTNGLITSTLIDDPGIIHSTMAIPALSGQGLAVFLILLISAFLSRRAWARAARFPADR